MIGSEIKVTPEAVIDAIKRIDELYGEAAELKGRVNLPQSKGPAAASVNELSKRVEELSSAICELLARDQKRLLDGLTAFEGTDYALAQMVNGLSGLSGMAED